LFDPVWLPVERNAAAGRKVNFDMITIVNIGISNLKSITRGFLTQGFEVQVTADPEVVSRARSLVLPGVGAFPKAMERLHSAGLTDAVRGFAATGRPLLGVCLGMQLLLSDSSEHVHTRGLDLIPGHVERFPRDRPVPHMGWNELISNRPSPLLDGVPGRADFYFVHSYVARPEQEEWVVGYSDHHGKFAAALQRDNVFGTQFHPEKSQDHGLRILRNFADLTERS
jgi:glutamine amidotransferase